MTISFTPGRLYIPGDDGEWHEHGLAIADGVSFVPLMASTANNYGRPICGTCSDTNQHGEAEGGPVPCNTVRYLAEPLAGKPGYDPSWQVSE